MSWFDQKQHPILGRITNIAATISAIVGATGVWWYVQDERERSITQSTNQASIQREQVAIRKELALQTSDLKEIRQVQSDIMAAFDKLDDGQKWLALLINNGNGELALELGKVIGKIENEFEESH